MGEIRVNFGALGEGQSSIMATHSQLVTTLDDLEANLQPMLETWDGAARDAYFQCKTQWDSAAAEMAQTLSQIAGAVGTANENYNAAETANTNAWG